jgi:DNA-binding MarR family transcriptional regulator
VDRSALIAQLMESLNAIRNKLVADAHSDFDGEQIRHSQFLVLHIVRQHEGIGVKELAKLLGVTSSAATQLVDGLVKKGFITREESLQDRRVSVLRQSDEGRRRIEQKQSQLAEKMSSLFEVLSDAELAEYCELNRRIAESFLRR